MTTRDSNVHRLNTTDRILDAAERLYADRGFPDTSLRTITSEEGKPLWKVAETPCDSTRCK